MTTNVIIICRIIITLESYRSTVRIKYKTRVKCREANIWIQTRLSNIWRKSRSINHRNAQVQHRIWFVRDTAGIIQYIHALLSLHSSCSLLYDQKSIINGIRKTQSSPLNEMKIAALASMFNECRRARTMSSAARFDTGDFHTHIYIYINIYTGILNGARRPPNERLWIRGIWWRAEQLVSERSPGITRPLFSAKKRESRQTRLDIRRSSPPRTRREQRRGSRRRRVKKKK